MNPYRAALLAAACVAAGAAARAQEPYTIDIAVGLTGGGAFLGKAQQKSLHLVEQEVNAGTVFRGIVQAGLELPIGTMTHAQMDRYKDFLPKELYIADAVVTRRSPAANTWQVVSKPTGIPLQ
jgi:hypothetical protein